VGTAVEAHAPTTKRPHWTSWQVVVTGVLLVLYLLLSLGVIFRSPVLTIDTDLLKLDLRHHYPEWKKWISFYVVLGQRGPATLFFLPWFAWMAWRRRSLRPLVMLGAALLVLNLSVGVVKLAIGRLGPLRTHQAHDVFVGGNIFPSGHVSNAVVLYGLMAMIVVSHRRAVIVAAVFLSVTIGAGTVYLDTHWFSDVVGGWIAGGLVLLTLPWIMPTAERWVDTLLARARAAVERRRAGRSESPAVTPAFRSGGRRYAPGRSAVQGKVTPVSPAASSHSFAATMMSFDARDEPTTRGNPRNSPIPSGP
jgi:membrane-associated phospholipid phosphatase